MDRQKFETLTQIIEEGNEIEGFLASKAWEIIRRTVRAQIESYRTDCYDAAKDMTKNLGNFLGRMEGLETLLRLIENDFSEAKRGALAERESMLELERESQDLDTAANQELSSPMLIKPGTI